MPTHTANRFRWSSIYRFSLPLCLSASGGCGGDRDALAFARQPSASVEVPHEYRNPVLYWSSVARRMMTPGPIVDARAFAIFSTAIHDAVNGIERRYGPYTAHLSSPGASLDAAVATAARDVMLAVSPSQRDSIESLYVMALARIPDGPAKEQGIALGRQSAKANFDRRAGDEIPVGSWPPKSGPVTEPIYRSTGAPGDYALTPPFDQPPMGPIALFPGWGRLTPFAVDLTKYKLAGPPGLTSEDYAKDVALVQALGRLDSRTRTPEQTAIAKFWFEDFPVMNEIAGKVLAAKGLDAWDSARTLALLHLAVADASIACFEAKYRFRFWRPFTAIRRAGDDNNPGTVADTSWLPLLWPVPDAPPPMFLIPPIPEYPSAAAVVASAAAEVLGSLLGDEQRFEVSSATLPGVTRRYSSFSQAADEAGMSRVYGGIHFQRAVTDGARLGRAVGRDVVRLLPPVRPGRRGSGTSG